MQIINTCRSRPGSAAPVTGYMIHLLNRRHRACDALGPVVGGRARRATADFLPRYVALPLLSLIWRPASRLLISKARERDFAQLTCQQRTRARQITQAAVGPSQYGVPSDQVGPPDEHA